ncbi:MAG: DUF58 domain-containing protein [Pirellulaceae bacterium]|nr:DUF58 domain-containing protein [Planctomycetota bacterium]
MERAPTSFDPRVLAKLDGLRLRARHIAEGYLVGAHRNPRAGFSTEFAEHREYVPGDDLRYLDWKVFGRSDKFYLKRFEDETNLLCYLAVDSSESMAFQGPNSGMSKWEYAQCMAAALTWVVLRQQDAVGMLRFDDRVRHWIEATNRSLVLEQVLDALEQPSPTTKGLVGRAINEIARRIERRGVVIIISDFFDDIDEIRSGLRRLRHRHCEVVLFQLLDPAELDFPFDVPTRFRGLEGLGTLRVNPVSLRAAYRQEMNQFTQQLDACCRELSVEYLLVRTDEPFDQTLRRFLVRRRDA